MENDTGITPAEWRYIELKGYMFSRNDIPVYGVKKGIRCMNCYSMVYIDKCPNDECYNFYEYCNYTKVDGLESNFWELVYKQHPELKENDNA